MDKQKPNKICILEAGLIPTHEPEILLKWCFWTVLRKNSSC